MGGTTWVYIFLGLYIIYCFYWGMKGYFTEKTSSGYAIAGRSIPFFAFLLAAHGRIVFRLDLYRAPGADLAGRVGLCLCLFLRADHPDYRNLFFQTDLAARETLRVYHARRHVCLLLQHRIRPLAGGADCRTVCHDLLGRSVDGICGPFPHHHRSAGGLRCGFHGIHRVVLCMHRWTQGQHLGRG